MFFDGDKIQSVDDVFETECAVAAVAFGYLVAAATDKSAASCNALLEVPANSRAKISAALAVAFHKRLEKIAIPQASNVLPETMLVLLLSFTLQMPVNKVNCLPVFQLNVITGIKNINEGKCRPPML